MINYLKHAYYLQWLGVKKPILIIAAAAMLIMPEHLLHLLAAIIHTLYESIAFALEELLVHGAGFTKFQAQLIVFYTSFAIGALAAIALIRRIPGMVACAKTLAIQRYIEIRADLIKAWLRLSTRGKIGLMMAQLAGMFGMVALLIS